MEAGRVIAGAAVYLVLTGSVPGQLNMELSPGASDAVLSWQSKLDGRYSVEQASSLVSNDWKTVSGRMVGTGGPLSVTGAVDRASGFFRLCEDEGPLTAFMWNLWTEYPVNPAAVKAVGANTIWLHGNESWFPENAATLETSGISCMPNYKVLNKSS